MRLSIAASILAQALPIISEVAPYRTDISGRTKSVLLLLGEENELPFENKTEDGRSSSIKVYKATTRSQTRRKQFSRRLKNKIASNTDTMKECDPVGPSVEAADIGILACGEGQYCMESENSTIGGICTMNTATAVHSTSRNLQAQQQCTFSQVGPDGFATVANCIIPEQCFQPCNTTCFAGTYDYALNEAANGGPQYDIRYCYYFTLPYEQSICIDVAESAASAECDAFFNGQPCSSCDIGIYSAGTTDTCIAVNCTNVPGGIAAGSCAGEGEALAIPISYTYPLAPLAPIYETKYKPCFDPCDPCSGGEMTNPDSFVDFLNISCSGLAYYGPAGFFPEFYCPFVKIFSREPCGCIGGDPPFSCPACDDGRVISKPDEVVYVPEVGEYSCALLDNYLLYYSGLGNITEDDCPMVQGLLEGPCGCMVPSTPAPVSSATPAPMASAADVPTANPTDEISTSLTNAPSMPTAQSGSSALPVGENALSILFGASAVVLLISIFFG